MRARAASKTELSLTIEPREPIGESAHEADHRRARYVAWGALLVSAAAIAGYLLEPSLSDSSSTPEASPSIEAIDTGVAPSGPA